MKQGRPMLSTTRSWQNLAVALFFPSNEQNELNKNSQYYQQKTLCWRSNDEVGLSGFVVQFLCAFHSSTPSKQLKEDSLGCLLWSELQPTSWSVRFSIIGNSDKESQCPLHCIHITIISTEALRGFHNRLRLEISFFGAVACDAES